MLSPVPLTLLDRIAVYGQSERSVAKGAELYNHAKGSPLCQRNQRRAEGFRPLDASLLWLAEERATIGICLVRTLELTVVWPTIKSAYCDQASCSEVDTLRQPGSLRLDWLGANRSAPAALIG